MNLLKFLIPIISFTFCYSNLFSIGHRINFLIKNTKDSTAILGHYYGKLLIPDDTVKVDKKGLGKFKGEKEYPQGMYFIIINKKKIDFLLGEDQKFNIETDINNLSKNLSFKGSKINSDFLTYSNQLRALLAKNRRLSNEKKNASKGKKHEIESELAVVFEDYKSLQNTYINNNSENILGAFIKATKDIEVPPAPTDEDGKVIDKNFQYNYYKTHYFDNIELSNPALLRTPIYGEKIEKYISKVIPNVPDSIINATDFLIEKARGDKQTFKFVLNYLYNNAAKKAKKYMGFDAVLIYIAANYYLVEADWIDQNFRKKLQDLVKNKSRILIGNTFPKFELIEVSSEHFIEAISNKDLIKDINFGTAFNSHDINTDYVIFYFWDPECSKCKSSAPLLSRATNTFKELGATIVSVNLVNGVEGKKKWVNFINKHEMYDWINAWNPSNHHYKRVMDLRSTNQVFVIDKDKKIIAKDIHPTRIESFLRRRSSK